jgi:hypothetical protein
MSDKPLQIYMEGDDVLVYDFANLGREAAGQWADHVRRMKDNIQPPVRVLLNFIDCGPPSVYAIQAQRTIAGEVTMPQDTRVAYLIPDSSYKLWARMLKRNRAFGEEAISIFMERSEALAWLREPHEPSSRSIPPLAPFKR